MTTRIAVALLVCALAACGPEKRPDTGGEPCSEGAQKCAGPDLQQCRGGELVTVETCPSECNDRLGCVLCQPSTAICLGNTSHACTDDGTAYVDDTCDGEGEDCGPDSGRCEKPCAPESLGESYTGCEYYPTVTGNMVSNKFGFAIIIANYNSVPVAASIDGAGQPTEQFLIPAQGVVVKKLAWHPDLKLCNADRWEDCLHPPRFSTLAAGGAYHLKMARPVAVYQFSPLDYRDPAVDQYSYTNDASLLFPINVWGTEYRVASWRETNGAPGLLAVTAHHDATTVTIVSTASTQGDATVPSLSPGVAHTVTLDRGDVIELGTIAAGDLTGSLVTSDKPVQVIGGHFCANVPFGTSYCDHLEESMIPVRALATQYVVTSPRSDAFPAGRIQMVRVIATDADTELAFDPPQPGVNTTLQRAGDYVELASTAANFAVSSNKKVLVVQYMIGQSATAGTADPAMSVAVPTGQFRTSYLFHAPVNYATNHVDVVAMDGATVTLDGALVNATAIPIGASGYSLIRLTLDHGPTGDGNHRIEGSAAFGISVYGYGDYTSYWYPGGLDLAAIVQ